METHFENITRHCQVSSSTYKNGDLIPNRTCISKYGKVIDKKGCSGLPIDTQERMIDGSNKKYIDTTTKIIKQIQTNKCNENKKYQTLGWKQAKEIKKWCNENNYVCNIIEDPIIERNKLQYIDVWFDENGDLYDDGTRDYGRQYLDFRSTKQNVVYVQIIKS